MIQRLCRRTTCALTIAALTACGASQAPVGIGTSAQNPLLPSVSRASGAWMAPAAKRADLLYVSDQGTLDVDVYSYPAGALVGTLTGFAKPGGLCVDGKGNVFVADYTAVFEYAHGGTAPVATISIPNEFPEFCSVDPTTGNLAITYSRSTSEVAIFTSASAKPQVHRTSPKRYWRFWSCAYDGSGNLFINGEHGRDETVTAMELPAGENSFVNLSNGQFTRYIGSLQWDGTHIAIGTQSYGSRPASIFQYVLPHKRALHRDGITPFDNVVDVPQFWIQRRIVIVPNYGGQSVGLYDYPAGGNAIETITGLQEPYGATVSVAK